MTAWIGLVARLILAGMWLVAGASKVTDLAASVRAVAAYDLMPYSVSTVVGVALPFVEMALGLLLLAGFATRLAATVSAVVLAAFIGGISAAWARGLRIDCGCFGGGGELAAGRSSTYFWEIARDVGLLAVAAYLVWRPVSRFALDRALTAEHPDDAEPADDEDIEPDDAEPEARSPAR
jgi:uncharacterized membrane protein YphA (DoxX/SURF4 family)